MLRLREYVPFLFMCDEKKLLPKEEAAFEWLIKY